MTSKAYIGDGVYVDKGSFFGEVVLTTEDGIRATNRIVLEPQVLRSLNDWFAAWMREAAKKEGA